MMPCFRVSSSHPFGFIAKYPNDEDKLLPPGEAMKLLKTQVVFLASKDEKIEPP